MHLCPGPLAFYPTLPLSESALPLSLHASLDDPESIKMTYDEKTCTLMKLLSVKSKLAAVF